MNNVDNIRLEQYRQIKKEIRGSSEYLITGIDIAKCKHYAFFSPVFHIRVIMHILAVSSICFSRFFITLSCPLRL